MKVSAHAVRKARLIGKRGLQIGKDDQDGRAKCGRCFENRRKGSAPAPRHRQAQQLRYGCGRGQQNGCTGLVIEGNQMEFSPRATRDSHRFLQEKR